MARSLLSYYRKPLISLFSDLLRINENPYSMNTLCYETQLRLIKYQFYFENRIRTLAKEKEILKIALHKNINPRRTKEQSYALKKKINDVEMRVVEYKNLINISKTIANGIVFSYLNKWDIKQFSFKEDAGFISGKRGFILEKKIFLIVFHIGKIALLNDLTSCLRHGDITVIESGKSPWFFEAKQSKYLSKRIIRQKESINEVLKFMYEGVRNFNGVKVQGVQLNDTEINYSNLLPELIRKGLQEGYSSISPEEGLIYFVATNVDYISNISEESKKFIEPKLNIISTSFFEPGYMPMPLLIREPSLTYQYFKGEFVLLICLDMDTIRKKYEKKGFHLELIKDNKDFVYRIIDRENRGFEVGIYIFSRLVHEFISLEWFINESINMYKNFKEFA